MTQQVMHTSPNLATFSEQYQSFCAVRITISINELNGDDDDFLFPVPTPTFGLADRPADHPRRLTALRLPKPSGIELAMRSHVTMKII